MTSFPGHVLRVMVFAEGLVAVFTLLILRSDLSTFRTLLNHLFRSPTLEHWLSDQFKLEPDLAFLLEMQGPRQGPGP